jgi:hypothetical protein
MGLPKNQKKAQLTGSPPAAGDASSAGISTSSNAQSGNTTTQAAITESTLRTLLEAAKLVKVLCTKAEPREPPVFLDTLTVACDLCKVKLEKVTPYCQWRMEQVYAKYAQMYEEVLRQETTSAGALEHLWASSPVYTVLLSDPLRVAKLASLARLFEEAKHRLNAALGRGLRDEYKEYGDVTQPEVSDFAQRLLRDCTLVAPFSFIPQFLETNGCIFSAKSVTCA